MFRKIENRKIPLQRYWTRWYVLTLAIGLIIVAIVSAWWIRHTTLENRLNMMTLMAEESAHQLVYGNTEMDDEQLNEMEVRQFLEEPGRFMQMENDPSVFIVRTNGEVLYSNQSLQIGQHQLNPTVLHETAAIEAFQSKENKDTLYMVKQPIEANGTVVGWVVFFDLKGNLTKVDQEYKQLFLVITALALLGWLAIYFLSRRLARPITDVASAAQKIKEGDYTFDLPTNVKEQEVAELIDSFKDMRNQLVQLETLRTELLAGVTHELKTPVTSIQGLIQAVRDGVVKGEEAEEFLDISLQETAKMKRMVEDLLAFNSFVAETIPIRLKRYDANELLQDIIKNWQLTIDDGPEITLQKMGHQTILSVDYIRFQQIMVNLLNNAVDALDEVKAPMISIIATQKEGALWIEMTDNGSGIRQGEQPFIFERFYRGEEKKFQVSGFGLGLPFSKMIAQALHGDLLLLKSSPGETSFRLILPIN